MVAAPRDQEPLATAPAFLRLLGPVELDWAGRTTVLGPERRCQLLACLAAQPGVWVERDRLASLLWPGRDPADARHNLRKVIFTARELAGAQDVDASPHALRWNVQTDLQRLQQGRLESLDAADAGWRGQPLGGLDDSGNPAWSEWLADERRRALALWQQAAHRRLRTLDDPPLREALAQRLLDADPCDEVAAQMLLRVLAETGRPGEAQRVFGRFEQRLRDELGLAPSHALRDLAVGAVAAFQPPRSAAAEPTPRPGAGAFVGRRLEARQVVELLGHERCRLLVLQGPGGMGKSRLAREIQPLLARHFAAGVHWVELDDLLELTVAVARIAMQLGVTIDDRGDAVDSLLRGLPDTPWLLVLDNAEHLAGLPELLQRLLAGCASLQVLVTSRRRLFLVNERVLVLAGLEVPDVDSRDADAASAFDAVGLFLQCAQAARPGFEARDHMDAVVGIVERLGGLPLAIQLAAAWVRLLSPAAILHQLQGPLGAPGSLDMLEADPAAAGTPARPAHASLRHVIEQSWQRLAPREAQGLLDLAVFAGGFMPDAARAVAQVPLPVLAALVDKSLLAVTESGRFVLHPVLATFVTERLAQSPERQDLLRERHASFYCRQLLALAPHARGRQRLLIEGVDAEFANARAAWAHAVATGRAELVSSAVNVWRIYYEVQGRLVEGRTALQPALQLPAASVSALRASATVRHALAMLAQRLGHLDEARALAEASITDGKGLEDAGAQIGGWLVLCNCAMSAGQPEMARDAAQRALACARAAGDPHGIATATGNLGIIEKRLGHYDVALGLYREALSVERTLENQLQVALHLNNIAALHLGRDQHDEALKVIAEGRAHCQRYGVALLLPYLALNEGTIALEQGRFADARVPLHEALAATRQAGQRQLELSVEICLARADLATGQASSALQDLSRVAASAQAQGLAVLLADCVGCAGEALLQQGRLALAARCLSTAAGQTAADARARARWTSALRDLPGEAPAASAQLFEECLAQLVAGRFG